jgi:hypothetical protein
LRHQFKEGLRRGRRKIDMPQKIPHRREAMTMNRLRAVILPTAAIAISLVAMLAVVLIIGGNTASAQKDGSVPSGFIKGRELLYLRLDDHEWRKGVNCDKVVIFDEGYGGWVGIVIHPADGQKLDTPERLLINPEKIVMYTLGENPSRNWPGNGAGEKGRWDNSGEKGRWDNSPRRRDWGNN